MTQVLIENSMHIDNFPPNTSYLIKSAHSKPIKIKLGKSLRVSSPYNYFVIGSNNVTIIGSKNEIIIDYPDNYAYDGLIRNPVSDTDTNIRCCGFDNITIKNIKIGQTTVKLNNLAGWICGKYFGASCSNVAIKKCINYANIELSSYPGIPAPTVNIGGMVGAYAQVNIYNCKNYGNIISSNAGGILAGYASRTKAKKCINYGNLNGEQQSGIFGVNSTGCSAELCFNHGNINGNGNGDSNSSGIAHTATNITINKCGNYGELLGRTSNGIAQCSNSIIYKCFNKGKISNRDISGIGSGFYNVIKASYNTGDISAADSAGITISDNVHIINCYSAGVQDAQSYGIAPDIAQSKIQHCYVASLGNAYGLDASSIVENSGSSPSWSDKIAHKYLQGIGKIWARHKNQPFELKGLDD